MMHWKAYLKPVTAASLLALFGILLTGCGATAVQIIPTDPPTETATPTATLTATPALDITPTLTPTPIPVSPTGGPSPTSIFGSTSTPPVILPTPTRVLNPNAPRIEYFTSDVVAVAPGEALNLFWSTRNVNGATIYRLDPDGQRSQLWNVPADGSLPIPTRRSDRGQVDFVLTVGDGASVVEQPLSVPLSCPDQWFFVPAPEECPGGPAATTILKEERFERGRMVYITETNQVYALFNDGLEPAWVTFENRYDPAIHPELEPSFQPPPGFYQPVGILGFAWRGRDVVRNRLGLGLEPEVDYEGATQSLTNPAGNTLLYLTSGDGTVLQLLPGGVAWQIITTP